VIGNSSEIRVIMLVRLFFLTLGVVRNMREINLLSKNENDGEEVWKKSKEEEEKEKAPN